VNAKVFFCLALVLNGHCRAAETNAITSPKLSVVKIVSPQVSVDLPKLGHAIFREQFSGFSLQVPFGFRKNGERTDTNNPVLQVWLLNADGTSIPQSQKPTVISLGTFSNYSTDYMFYKFGPVSQNELAGVVVSLNSKFYCHAIEMTGWEPSVAPDENLIQISPANIANYPLSVSVTNFDNYEHITVFYKTGKAVFDKFLSAREELSDGDAVISSEPVAGVWMTNGVRFECGGGAVSPFKFEIIEQRHRGETAMPGYSGYWFYERDFATNSPSKTNNVQVQNDGNHDTTLLQIPGLNEPIILTTQPRQYTVQLEIADYPGIEFRPMGKVAELHRQAWLLRADGTIVSQAQPPQKAGVGNGGWEDQRLIFKFPCTKGEDAVGLAVSIGGNLYCRALK
jgi:hypothetical protein